MVFSTMLAVKHVKDETKWHAAMVNSVNLCGRMVK